MKRLTDGQDMPDRELHLKLISGFKVIVDGPGILTFKEKYYATSSEAYAFTHSLDFKDHFSIEPVYLWTDGSRIYDVKKVGSYETELVMQDIRKSLTPEQLDFLKNNLDKL